MIRRPRRAQAAFLDKQRDILVRKIEGVTDEDARKTPTASSFSLLGILKHRALWERRWFQIIVAGRTFPGRVARGQVLRWVLMHHIEEVARHAGHADIIRETIDGSTGE